MKDEWKRISIIPNTLVREVSVSHTLGTAKDSLSEPSAVRLSLQFSPFIDLHHEAARISEKIDDVVVTAD